MEKKCQRNKRKGENSIIPMEQEEEETNMKISKDHIKNMKSTSNLNTSSATTNYSITNQSFTSVDLSKSSNKDKSSAEKCGVKKNIDCIREIYMNLLLDEKYSNLKIKKDYILAQKDINESMRAILVDWLIDVHFLFRLKQRTLFQAINIIDLYLSYQLIERSKFQLLGIVALFISCKENEISLPRTKDLADISDKAYTPEEILNMEKKVLECLNFEILCPTAEEFYNIISSHFNFDEIQHHLGEYFLESSLYDCNMNNYKSSIRAIACVYFVMKYYRIKGYNKLYSFEFTFENSPEKIIKECAKKLCFLVKNLSNSKLQSARKKYSLGDYGKVATNFD